MSVVASPADVAGNSSDPRPISGPPSKGRGHCSLCHERRICPSARPGTPWRECGICGDSIQADNPPSYAIAIERHL